MPVNTDVHPIDYMAMWEAFLEGFSGGPRKSVLEQVREAVGTVAMRHFASVVTAEADKLWKSLSDADKATLAPWDWEFCPRYLALVNWTGDGRNTEYAPVCPDPAVARQSLLSSEPRGGAPLNIDAERNDPSRRNPEITYTAFCADEYAADTIWIQAITASDLEEAKEVARTECAESWQCAPSGVKCIGLAEGDINILFWDDA